MQKYLSHAQCVLGLGLDRELVQSMHQILQIMMIYYEYDRTHRLNIIRLRPHWCIGSITGHINTGLIRMFYGAPNKIKLDLVRNQC